MADILIRGISLPEGELKYVTLWVYGDGRVYVSNSASAASSQRLQDLAVPLPEGHGELIDKQAFIADIAGFIECMTKAGVVVDGELLWGKLLDALANAKTIVPAEGDDNE